MNQIETAKILSILYSVFSNERVTDEKGMAWHLALDDVPYDAVEGAVREWLRSGSPFFPSRPS